MAKKKKALTRGQLVALGIPLIFFPGMVLASQLGWNWQKGLEKVEKAGGFEQTKVIFPTLAKVAKVDDGDTILIDNGQQVRLIAVNAPDRGEKGYEESRRFLETMILGEKVRLEYDTYQEDKYGRLLAYVFEKCSTEIGCKDGERMVNFVIVKEGMGEFVIYKDRRKLKYQDFLETAQP